MNLFPKATQPSKHMNEPIDEPIDSVALFVTQSCNLRCVYCFGEGDKYGTGGRMDESIARLAVDWLIEHSGPKRCIHIGFFGGEPLLNFPLIKKVVAYAQKRASQADKTVNFNMTTNATLLDDEVVIFIQEHDISVMISCDGPKEIHDKQRPFADGSGSYDVIAPKVKKLLAVRPETKGHAVLMEGVDPEVVSAGLKEIGFSSFYTSPASGSLHSCNRKTAKQERDLHFSLKALDKDCNAWIRHIRGRNVGALSQLRQTSQLGSALVFFLQQRKIYYPCGAGRTHVGISCSGDIYLCHRFVGIEEYIIGSVFQTDLDRGAYLERPIERVKVCRQCPAKYYCAGGCKHDHACSTGSVFEPSMDMCRLRKKEFELAGYIDSQLDDSDRTFLLQEEIFPPKPCPIDFG